MNGTQIRSFPQFGIEFPYSVFQANTENQNELRNKRLHDLSQRGRRQFPESFIRVNARPG